MEVLCSLSTWGDRKATDVLTGLDAMSERLSRSWNTTMDEDERCSCLTESPETCVWQFPRNCMEDENDATSSTDGSSPGCLFGFQETLASVSQVVDANGTLGGALEATNYVETEHCEGAEIATDVLGGLPPASNSQAGLSPADTVTSEWETRIVDLDMDSLINCVSRLGLRDLANMALSCRRLRDAAYADPVWHIQCRESWPAKQLGQKKFVYSGGREAYVARHTATHQFRFTDPVDWQFRISPSPVSHLSLEDDRVTVAQGSNLSVWKLGCADNPPTMIHNLRDHNARITCMRLFPTSGLGTLQNTLRGENHFLVSSSCDHTIRLWGKGKNLRTFCGHSGPVSTLADHLLGDNTVLASGGLDGTVRLWALPSPASRGRSPLVATLHGHESAVRELAVAGHNNALLVSAGKDFKVRVWDTTTASTSSTGSCVGYTRSPGLPAALRCNGATCYVVGASAAVVIDLRIMRSVATVATHEPGIVSFAIEPSKSTVCTGGTDGTAKLWDVRKCQGSPEPWAVLGNHVGAVSSVHIDTYKIVTGGQEDGNVYVWDANTGRALNALESIEDLETLYNRAGVSAIAVRGTRLVTGTCAGLAGVVRIRDFSNCSSMKQDDLRTAETAVHSSRFWAD